MNLIRWCADQLKSRISNPVNFPRISGHTERIEIKEENFIKEVCYE
jgi:hypothetical protein